MSYLLDSPVWLWALQDPLRLSPRQRAAIEGPANLYLSVVSLWELAHKVAIGKLRVSGNVEDYFGRALARNSVEIVAVESRHAFAAARLPPHHRDPFDRMIVAQARIEGLTLLTQDRALAQYDVEVIP